jgi:hypothetical protein
VTWRLVTGALGAAATLFGVGSLFVPALGRLWSDDPATLATADPTLLAAAATALAGGVVVALFAGELVARGRPASASGMRAEATTSSFAGPEASDATAERGAVDHLDADVRAAVQSGGDSLAAVRERLRATATAAYADAAAVPVETAARAVDDGAWTDDALAADFLADRELSGRARLRLWLRPARERRRRVERTIGAIERLRAEP